MNCEEPLDSRRDHTPFPHHPSSGFFSQAKAFLFYISTSPLLLPLLLFFSSSQNSRITIVSPVLKTPPTKQYSFPFFPPQKHLDFRLSSFGSARIPLVHFSCTQPSQWPAFLLLAPLSWTRPPRPSSLTTTVSGILRFCFGCPFILSPLSYVLFLCDIIITGLKPPPCLFYLLCILPNQHPRTSKTLGSAPPHLLPKTHTDTIPKFIYLSVSTLISKLCCTPQGLLQISTSKSFPKFMA